MGPHTQDTEPLNPVEKRIHFTAEVENGLTLFIKMDKIYDDEAIKSKDDVETILEQTTSDLITRHRGQLSDDTVQEMLDSADADYTTLGYYENDNFITLTKAEIPTICQHACKYREKPTWIIRFPPSVHASIDLDNSLKFSPRKKKEPEYTEVKPEIKQEKIPEPVTSTQDTEQEEDIKPSKLFPMVKPLTNKNDDGIPHFKEENVWIPAYDLPVDIDKKNSQRNMETYCLSNKEEIITWYQDFTEHCHTNGIYIPCYEALRPNKPMGMDWTLRNVTPMKRKMFHTMKHEIHKLLLYPDMFPKTDTQYTDAVIASNGNRYIVLHNIMRTCHPNLMKTEIETTIPTQRRSETFGSYIRKIQNFLAREKIRCKTYMTRQQTLLVGKPTSILQGSVQNKNTTKPTKS